MAEVDVDVGSVIAGVGIPRVRQSGEESVQSLLRPLGALTSLTGINCSAYVQCVCEKNMLWEESQPSFLRLIDGPSMWSDDDIRHDCRSPCI